MKRFAIRKVKNGRVKINGSYYYPPSDERYNQYLCRLEGRSFAFGLYVDHANKYNDEYVILWGTKEHYYNMNDTDIPECIDGTFPWKFWDKENKA